MKSGAYSPNAFVPPTPIQGGKRLVADVGAIIYDSVSPLASTVPVKLFRPRPFLTNDIVSHFLRSVSASKKFCYSNGGTS